MLSRSSIQLWFCLSVAAISAAIADPLVEWASNAGIFGPGNFTDHSSADVFPAIVVGTLLLIAYAAARVRRALRSESEPNWLQSSRDALSGNLLRLLPLILGLQVAALYCMETSEQLAVFGHPLGGTVWLGGPIFISLALHAIVCGVVAYACSRAVGLLARSAVRAVRLILAMAVRAARGLSPIELDRTSAPFVAPSFFIVGNTGERAPPLLTA
jgi:hypothetical protein